MNKSELIAHIAEEANLSKADAERALQAIIGGVKHSLKEGADVAIAGFGTFKISRRAARKGRNPRTGATLDIAASNIPVFKAGKNFKEEMNEK
ncbi:MAG: HU family DNA-binding protein [Pseudomonadota bacterium]|nr:HU family DNA-binding protein [Gammaproteobacteria bacterium]MBU1629168.1 HU family DNA-binding protein [Gammaproteobacteria bacterium]MBU1926295.1 HU family DNA-binding protein [Gammaproteobacteria bacterium]MBU2545628.1 HU family DNA-binding protein [Gammaproteobacteria bacterium]